MIAKGTWRGERVATGDGDDAVCIWQPLLVEDEQVGYCLDFRPDDIDDLIALLQELKTATPTEIELEVEDDGDDAEDEIEDGE